MRIVGVTFEGEGNQKKRAQKANRSKAKKPDAVALAEAAAKKAAEEAEAAAEGEGAAEGDAEGEGDAS